MFSQRRIYETALLTRRFLFWPLSMSKLSHHFTFQGLPYRYLYHPNNETWMNERAVEVPIIWPIVQAAVGKRVLEVGNVLSNYFPCRHDILDKYDTTPGIINEDVVDFKPARLYDLIVSMATLHHVGWDEEIGDIRDPTKFLQAVRNLERSLAPGGVLVVTLPLRRHPEIDALCKSGNLPFTSTYYLERISWSNRWRETDRPVFRRFPRPFPGTRILVIGVAFAGGAGDTSWQGMMRRVSGKDPDSP